MYTRHFQGECACGEMLLDGSPSRDQAPPRLPVDFQRALEMGRHELEDGVQLAELTVRSDDHGFRDGMAIGAGQTN